IEHPAHRRLRYSELEIEMTHMVDDHHDSLDRAEKVAPFEDIRSTHMQPGVPAELGNAVHGTPNRFRLVDLSPTLPEMKAGAPHSGRMQPLELAVRQRVAHDADCPEVLAFFGDERRQLIDEQTVIDVVALGVDDDPALKSHGAEHFPHVRKR